MELKDFAGQAGMSFSDRIKKAGKYPLLAFGVEILQVNVGRLCNLSCRHCHLEASPTRTEIMPWKIMQKCLAIAQSMGIATIDITGGAPEMNPHMAWFIIESAKLKKRLIVRSNLAVLDDVKYSGFINLYADKKVEIVASLPDFTGQKSDTQRGIGTFDKIIKIIKKLNSIGYAKPGSGLVLDVVHNPVGAYLPGPQKALEFEYRRHLSAEYGIEFNRLFCIINMPLGRYLDYLVKSGNFEDYMSDLVNSFNPANIDAVMCRNTVSVGWDGSLYDCDFNQALNMKINHGAPDNIMDFDMEKLKKRQIVIENHCYGCTAGAGSSCHGATSG